jgi:uncharacterized protein (TIGR04551 family)
VKRGAVALIAALLLAAAPAHAADEAADDLQLHPLAMTPSPWREFRLTLDGYLRVRGELWNDLDLSRGPTPTTGQPIFPTPAAGGDEHTLTAMDMRLRLEPTLEIGQTVRLHVRADVLDNVGWGSTPDVPPSGYALASQNAAVPQAGVNSLKDAIAIKQAWGEVVLPFGTLAAGRMGGLVSWGTGFFINNGDCLDCDHGDTGDRVALTVPLWSHYLTVLYELSASGPYADLSGQNIDLERRTHVNTWALAVARYDSPEAQRRKLRAGRWLVQYGVIGSYRYQDVDAPAWTQSMLPRAWGPNEFVKRGLDSFAGDLWLLVHRGGFRAELEVATVIARIADATNTPGVSLRRPVTLTQVGGVASLAYSFRAPVRLRVEVGFASGDDAPGFGVRFPAGQLTTQKGDLDGPQLRPPADNTVDNFRFHPDYHVDLILWRRIIGQVTDAVYVRPSLRAGPFGSANHHLFVEAALIDSSAIYATSPPGQANHLGVELDLAARYRYEHGFEMRLSYGLFLPGDGFRNLELHLDPQPAQALELILAYRI